MEPERSVIVSYRCPRCQTMLEAGRGQADSWLRCPKCTRPSLPPAYSRLSALRRAPERDVVYLGDFDRLQQIPPALIIPAKSFSPWRILFVAGLLVSLSLLVMALLEEAPLQASVFGLVAIFCFGILAVPRKRA